MMRLPSVEHRGDDHAGHALRAPSKLHSFNRYEIKYLLPSDRVPALRAELTRRMDADSHGADGGYGVWSTYYDTRFYTLAVVAAISISLIIVVMYRFNWFAANVQRQVVKVQIPPDGNYTQHIQDVLIAHTSEFELVSIESIRGGALTELMYTVRLKKGTEPGRLITALGERTGGQRVTVLTGYDQTDL